MSWEVEYERPYQRDEPESLQNIILKGYFYNIVRSNSLYKYHTLI